MPGRELARQRLGIRGLTFVFAGRPTPQKNLPLAVAAPARLPHGSLVVIGDCPGRVTLAEVIRREGVEERVVVHGALPCEQTFE